MAKLTFEKFPRCLARISHDRVAFDLKLLCFFLHCFGENFTFKSTLQGNQMTRRKLQRTE